MQKKASVKQQLFNKTFKNQPTLSSQLKKTQKGIDLYAQLTPYLKDSIKSNWPDLDFNQKIQILNFVNNINECCEDISCSLKNLEPVLNKSNNQKIVRKNNVIRLRAA